MRAASEDHMTEQSRPNEESPAVQSHLTIVQGVIQRMAENSRSCKLWCITLVSAVLVFVVRTDNPDHALIALVPLFLFLVLDTYYLALERAFRDSYNAFVEKLPNGTLASLGLYVVAPTGSIPKVFARSLGSFSIWPFYVILVAMILLIWYLLMS